MLKETLGNSHYVLPAKKGVKICCDIVYILKYYFTSMQ